MSSDSENDLHEDLLRTTEEVMRAKETNPGMFVSAWQADEEDISYWTKKELKKDPKKLFILSGQRGDIGTMKSILESEVGPNWADEPEKLKGFLLAKDGDGYTALHRAVYSGQVPAAEFLIRSGANVESKTEDGWRPLHSAAFWNQLACVQLLLEVGADITAVTSSGQSVLHLALANNRTPETLAYLLAQLSSDREAFSKVWNHRNKSGDTPENLLMRSSSLGPFLMETFSSEATCLGNPSSKMKYTLYSPNM
nr:ankyrin repeat domain containing protein 49 [Hymenolepis microstoma]